MDGLKSKPGCKSEKELKRLEKENLKQAKDIFENFYITYNNKRILKCILYKTPTLFFDLAESHLVSVVYDIKSKKQLFSSERNRQPNADLFRSCCIVLG